MSREEELGTLENSSSYDGMTIRVVVDDSVYHPADRVTGTVYVIGGRRLEGRPGDELRLESLKLELQEYWYQSGYGGSTSVKIQETSILEGNPTSIIPSFEGAYRFAVRLPQNCRFSTQNSGWRIVAIADRRLAIDPNTSVRLHVMPAKEILAFVEACVSRLKYVEQSGMWNERTTMTDVKMLPSVALQPQIDSLRFSLKQNEAGGVVGSVVVRYATKSLLESLGALFASKERWPEKSIELGGAHVFHSDGSSNEDAIAQYVEALVDEAIRERHST